MKAYASVYSTFALAVSLGSRTLALTLTLTLIPTLPLTLTRINCKPQSGLARLPTALDRARPLPVRRAHPKRNPLRRAHRPSNNTTHLAAATTITTPTQRVGIPLAPATARQPMLRRRVLPRDSPGGRRPLRTGGSVHARADATHPRILRRPAMTLLPLSDRMTPWRLSPTCAEEGSCA